VPADDLSFEMGGPRYALDELPDQSDTLWYLQEHPLLVLRHDPPVELGERHDIGIAGELRLPAMQIAPGADSGPGLYVPNVVRPTLSLVATDRPSAAPALVSDVPAALADGSGSVQTGWLVCR
jgi:hypothetical protein